MSKTISEEIRNKIVCLWQEGFSGGEIAEKIGTTRNAVIGLIGRERKKGRDLRKIQTRVKPMRVKPPVKIVSIFEKKLPASMRKNLKIHELTSTSCRFIVSGEGANSIFCGDKQKRRSYCEKHAEMCYIPIRKN